MKIVTINREYGSGGRRVAFMLSEKLGIPEQKSISLLYGISLIANNWADETDRQRRDDYYFQYRKRVG